MQVRNIYIYNLPIPYEFILNKLLMYARHTYRKIAKLLYTNGTIKKVII